jgi:hypothetical protein
MAYDIAFYVGAPNTDGWYDVATQTRDVATIIARTGHMFKDIQQFKDDQLAAFGAWVDKNTNDGEMDIIWLNGCMPSCLYQFPNVNPDGSRAEKWLDAGNMIINVGDWFAYCSFEGGSRQADNAGSGAANILDLSASVIAGGGQGVMTVTPTGTAYLPSLNSVTSDRPVLLSAVVDPWEVAAIFAENAAGTYADPVVLVNADTGGYVAFINQASTGNWIADRGLTCAEFIGNWVSTVIGGQAFLKARRPNPADGATGILTPLIQWTAGNTAAFHDVYFGTNPTPGPAEYKGRQQYLVYWAGSVTPGTTYYWRIDEVEADGVTMHTGDVWSFAAAPLTAYSPIPSDGAKWVATDADLSWTAGATGIKHDVYFGTDQTAVANGTAGTLKSSQQTPKTYEPGTLALDTTYYWRIDEFDSGVAKYPGTVWSFTTIGANAGIRGYYFNNMNLTGAPALVRIDPAIGFNWGAGTPGAPITVDTFSVRWVGVVEAQYSEPYVFTTNSDDGIRMWLNDVLIIDSWIDQSAAMHSSSAINLIAGQRYGVRVEFYENGGDAVAQLLWQSPSIPRQIIPAGALQLPLPARNPIPVNGAVDVKDTPTLRWSAGEKAVKHNVYFGTDATVVTNATTSSAGIYRGQQDLAANSYVPSEAPLAWNSTYYWRIDEVNAADTWKGGVWSFTTANFIVVDDFEDYTDDVGSRIFQTWKDGWGYNEPAPGYAGNGTGSTVGYGQAPFAEQTTVHGGSQSMPLGYDNSGAAGKARYSETFREWASPQDWTRNNVRALALWFYGDPNNAAEQLYVAVEDNAAHVKVVNYPDLEAVQAAGWQEWNIELTQFSAAGVNLKAIKKIYIGLGNRSSPKLGGTGTIYVDDIAVYPSRCVPSMLRPDADIAWPYDCKVGYEDLGILAGEWLFETQVQDWEYRAAYWDSRYRTNWATDANSITVRDGLVAAGYTILDADQLKTWMNARIADKKLSVVVFCRDNAPDTVVESVDATCTLRRYLDAGGKIVFYADIPFYDIAHADGTWDNPADAGAPAILGFNTSSAPRDTYDTVTITGAGASWGLAQTWSSQRPAAAGITTNLTVLATDAAGNAPAWVKHYLPRDKARGFVRIWDTTGTPPVADVISVAESKGALAADLNADKKVDFKDYAKLADSWLEEILWP